MKPKGIKDYKYIRIRPDLSDKLAAKAQAEKRSATVYLELLLEKHL